MFQFGRFPTYTYVFSIRSMVLHHGGFPIRKSADIMLICSSPRLIAACHVLHRLLMPRHSPYALFRLNFLQSFLCSFSRFSWIAWVSWTFFRFVNSCEKVLSFCLNFYSTFRWNCILPKLERPIKFYFANLVKIICPLICSFLTLQYTLFGFQWAYIWNTLCFKCQVSLDGWTPSLCLRKAVKLDLSLEVSLRDLVADFYRLVGSSGLEPPTSRLSGARSNHLSYEPM